MVLLFFFFFGCSMEYESSQVKDHMRATFATYPTAMATTSFNTLQKCHNPCVTARTPRITLSYTHTHKHKLHTHHIFSTSLENLDKYTCHDLKCLQIWSSGISELITHHASHLITSSYSGPINVPGIVQVPSHLSFSRCRSPCFCPHITMTPLPILINVFGYYLPNELYLDHTLLNYELHFSSLAHHPPLLFGGFGLTHIIWKFPG